MKRNLLFLLALGVLLASVAFTSILLAQAPGGNVVAPPTNAPAANSQPNPQPRPQIPVAVVDYVYLLEIHPFLYAETNKLLQQKKQANDSMQKDMEQLQKLQRELQSIITGTPQYSAKMEEIRVFQAGAQLRAIKQTEEIDLAALQLQYNAFKEIRGMVQLFAQNNNISVIINNPDISRRLPVENSTQKSTQAMDMEMSQMQGVVWFLPGLDITSHIEKMLNDTYTPKGYDIVDYNKYKEQVYGKPSGGAAMQAPGVATGSGQPVRQ